jgi:hypothetical protein
MAIEFFFDFAFHLSQCSPPEVKLSCHKYCAIKVYPPSAGYRLILLRQSLFDLVNMQNGILPIIIPFRHYLNLCWTFSLAS